jgi:hypothetical protein
MKAAAYLAIKAKYAEEAPVFHDETLKGEGLEDSILSVDFEPIYETMENNKKSDLSYLNSIFSDVYESLHHLDVNVYEKPEVDTELEKK